MSDSLQPHGLQHTRLPYFSPTSGAYPNSCPSSQWCHSTTSFSVVPSAPALIVSQLRVFSIESVLHIRWPKYWSFSFSMSPSDEYSDWFPLGWTGWISLLSKGISSLIQHHSSKASVFVHSAVTSIHDQWKNHSFDYTDLCWQSNVSTF